MEYTLYYDNYAFVVEQTYQDILEYEFNKRFKEHYDPYYTLYTKEQKDFVKDFDYKWLCNEIHCYDYYTSGNFDFLDWLKDKYELAMEQVQYAESLEELDPDDWWDGLDYATKQDVMDSYCG